MLRFKPRFQHAASEDEDWEYKACLQAAATDRALQGGKLLGKLVPAKSAAEVQPLLQQTKVLLGKASTAHVAHACKHIISVPQHTYLNVNVVV